jgi:hypothetical protein
VSGEAGGRRRSERPGWRLGDERGFGNESMCLVGFLVDLAEKKRSRCAEKSKVAVADESRVKQCSAPTRRAPTQFVTTRTTYVLSPFRNIRCFSFVKKMYLDILVYRFVRIYTLKDV